MAWEIYLSKLPYSKRMDLCDILDPRNKWKELASDLKYGQNKINRLELALQRPRGSPTDELLFEYGHLNPTLSDLYKKLQKLKIVDAAQVIKDYVDMVEAENGTQLRLDSDLSDSSESSSTSDHPRQCKKLPAPSCTPTTQHSDWSNLNDPQTATTKVLAYDRSNIPQENLGFDTLDINTTNMFLNNPTMHGGIYADNRGLNNTVTAVKTNTDMLPNKTYLDTYSGISSSVAAENRQRSTDYTDIHFNSLSSPPPAYTGTFYNKLGTQQYSSGYNYPAENLSNKLMYPPMKSEEVTESSSLRMPTNIHVFQYDEIRKSTYGFDEEFLYGRGCFGEVYQAKLSNKTFAIKRFFQDNPNKDSLKMKYMRSEVEKLEKYQHKNILCLSGYSNDGPELCFVFDFMCHGSLEDQLHGTHGRVTVLSIIQRYNILIGAAKGLKYLHSLDKPVIHGDIKSANILIDENCEAKISDLGQASIATGTNECGNYMHVTPYLPPESEGIFKMSLKGDTFSFGIVICECCTGEKPQDGKREGGVLLKDYINNSCGMGSSSRSLDDESKAGLHKRLCDKKIIQKNWPFKEWYDVFVIGRECISEQRPIMREVLYRLEATYYHIQCHIRKPDDHVQNDGNYVGQLGNSVLPNNVYTDANAIPQHPRYPSDTYAQQSFQHLATNFNAAYEEPNQLPVTSSNTNQTIWEFDNQINKTEKEMAALTISDKTTNQYIGFETEGVENKNFPSFIKSLSSSESDRSGDPFTSISDEETLPDTAVQNHFCHEPSLLRFSAEAVLNKRLPSFAGGSISSNFSGGSDQSDSSSNGERFNSLEGYNYTEGSSAIQKDWPNFVNNSRMVNTDGKDSKHGRNAVSLDAEAVRNCDKYSLYNSKMDEPKCYSDPGPAVWNNKSFRNLFQKSTLSGPQALCVPIGTKPIYQQVDFQL